MASLKIGVSLTIYLTNAFRFKKSDIFIFVLIVGIGFGASYFPLYKEKLRWNEYFTRTGISEANPLVVQVMSNVKYALPSKAVVLDLGAGNGNDTKYLLEQGFDVYAIDFNSESIKRINQRQDIRNRANLTVIKSSFQGLSWNELPNFDAIIAVNSISFVNHKHFQAIWKSIHSNLKPGGLFIGRLLGDQLHWPYMKNMSLMNRAKLEALSEGYEILRIDEEKNEEKALVQHSFNVVLKKKVENGTT